MATAAISTPVSIRAARLAMVGIIVYQPLIVALIFLRPDVPPTWHIISEWAIGPYGSCEVRSHVSAELWCAVCHAEVATRHYWEDRSGHTSDLRDRRHGSRNIQNRPMPMRLPLSTRGPLKLSSVPVSLCYYHSRPDYHHILSWEVISRSVV